MKVWMVAVAALVLGAAIGCGVTWYEFHNVPEIFVAADAFGSKSGEAPPQVPKAKVKDGTTHEFGAMQLGQTRSHEFVFVNEGTAPLLLSKTGTPPTCQCTQFEVPTEPIAPGESGKVLLEWKPNSFTIEFRQSADVRTNDPQRELVPLTIRGSVVQYARALPDVISLSNASTDEGGVAQGRVFGYMSDKLEVESFEFLNAETAKFFDATWEPLPSAEVSRERISRSGLTLTITAKPGLPLGSISQTIRLTFDAPEPAHIDIPIGGMVGSDISILGSSSFNKESQTLRLGLVKGSQGAKAELRVLVKGPHKDTTKLKVASTDPENILRATVGEPTPTPNGKAVVHVVTVEVPAGSPSVNRIGSDLISPGRILIDTTHPEVKQLSIAVNFAVEE